MDFTNFVPSKMIPSLHWLGRRTWIEYGDIPDRRQMWGRPKELVFLKPGQTPTQAIKAVDSPPWLKKPDPIYVTAKEYAQHPPEFWTETKRITTWLNHNVISTFLMFGMSKALADGPKIFKATTQQCLDLASDEGEMTCDYPFSDYHQPYPVFILELPVEYQQRLKAMFKSQSAPTHVFCHHEPGRIITVAAFFGPDNIVTHLTPNRDEYDTLEDAIVSNRRRVTPSAQEIDPTAYRDPDYDIAEVVQRLAINFGMWMTFIGTHVKGPIDPGEYQRLKQMANLKSHKKQKRAGNARNRVMSMMHQIVFDQVVEFHDEVIEIDARPDHQGGTHRSPRPHRRRAHWRNQAFGPQLSERKWIPIKAVIVRKAAFVADQSKVTTTYVTKK